MRDTTANKIASFNTTIAVVDQDDFKPLWTNKAPLGFGLRIAEIWPALA